MVVPLSINPSSNWIGNDGSWSPFTISVGTPKQSFDVLLGTKVQNLWVPIADECVKLSSTACGSSRGVLPFAQRLSPGFQYNSSSSWETIGIYELGIGRNLGITGNGLNGFDTIGLSSIELKRVPVIAYASPGFWVGQLGLLPTTLNFSNTISSPSFLRSLKNDNRIPSLSYGYQAGASYRNAKVPASLTIGGYDRSRLTEPPLTVSIAPSLDFVVGLQNIIATNTLEGTSSLMSNERVLATIDSSVPDLWLPRSICDKFESAFGLQYHEPSGRYLVSDDNRTRIEEMSPTLSFTIGTSAIQGGNTTIIRIPYSAFDLEVSFPYFAEATKYFPIRRASNDSQYTIGRAFLQETYLGVDWEHNIFNLSQAKFADPMPTPDIVTIPAKASITNPPSQEPKKSMLSTGAIVGIVLGGVALLCLLLAVLWYLRRRKQTTEQLVFEEEQKFEAPPLLEAELMGRELARSENHHELPVKNGHSELQDFRFETYELRGSDVEPVEMPAKSRVTSK